MDTRYLLPLALFALMQSACKKDEPAPPTPPTPVPTTGSVKVDLDFVFGMGGAPFALNQEFTHPLTGDQLTFTEYRFYLSNIQLRRSDGGWWAEPESYRIVNAADAAGRSFTITGVPAGSYTAMRYTLGVDSTRNVSGAQTGALSATNGMFWSWTTGYIMLKVEGLSPQSSSGGFAFHLGGFSGANNIVTERETDLAGNTLSVGSGTPVVKFRANAARLWHNTGTSVAVQSTVHMPGPVARDMATGFWDGILFTGIE